MTKITPRLWLNDNAEEAVSCYLSIFPTSEVTQTTYYEANNSAPRHFGVVAPFTASSAPHKYHWSRISI